MSPVSADLSLNPLLRTTCVATLIEGGHVANALPQRVTASVNCRIAPGETAAETKAAIEQVIADPQVKVSPSKIQERPVAVTPPLDLPRLWNDPATAGTHGLNERISTDVLYRGWDYIYDLVTHFASH
jgi:acetylornithine deacetylase/succinyl-diaminopimelate desuccinylase-like protein